MELKINGRRLVADPPWDEELLLNALREHWGLVGAKFGCGVGLCGACTVLLDGEPVRSCITPVAAVGAREVTTVEGLHSGPGLHPVQQAWLTESVPQCGYCQTGHIMAAVALLRQHPHPTEAQVDAALAGHLCRCGTQQRVRRAVMQAARSAP
jgi:isoquinoline 1-oxidoreductase alpha subunit